MGGGERGEGSGSGEGVEGKEERWGREKGEGRRERGGPRARQRQCGARHVVVVEEERGRAEPGAEAEGRGARSNGRGREAEWSISCCIPNIRWCLKGGRAPGSAPGLKAGAGPRSGRVQGLGLGFRV